MLLYILQYFTIFYNTDSKSNQKYHNISQYITMKPQQRQCCSHLQPVFEMPIRKPAGSTGAAGTAMPKTAPGHCVASPHEVPRLNDRILQLKDEWLHAILFTGKTVEIRGQGTKPGGLWLGKSGQILGYARVISVKQIEDMASFNELKDLHQIKAESLPYAKTFAWFLDSVEAVGPFQYKIKRGPVTWAKFATVSGTHR